MGQAVASWYRYSCSEVSSAVIRWLAAEVRLLQRDVKTFQHIREDHTSELGSTTSCFSADADAGTELTELDSMLDASMVVTEGEMESQLKQVICEKLNEGWSR